MQHLVIVGLGNPGISYISTRHNVGFIFCDFLKQQFNAPEYSNKFGCLVSSFFFRDLKITLAKPQSYVNNSGIPVTQLTKFYKLTSQDMIVVHDDLDLQFAKVKMKIAGSSGGHNGLKSIDQYIGNNYYRLRIGIDKPVKMEVSNYVLSKFLSSEEKIIDYLFKTILDNFDLFLKKDISNFSNKINSIMEPLKDGV